MQICCPACNFVANNGNNINLTIGKFVNGIHSLCPKTVDSTNAYVVNVRLNLPLYHVSWLWFWFWSKMLYLRALSFQGRSFITSANNSW